MCFLFLSYWKIRWGEGVSDPTDGAWVHSNRTSYLACDNLVVSQFHTKYKSPSIGDKIVPILMQP